MALVYKDFLQKLKSVMDIYQAEAELNLILESVDFSKIKYLSGFELSKDKAKKVDFFIKKRIEEKIPIQYLLGFGYFMGEKFFVNEDVLIPRPETELLVQKTIEFNGKKLLDIGTGTGCIAIMVKKLSNKDVMACDISQKALEVAQKNAKNLHAEVDFIKSDLFENINEKFDIIVSNPPYIPKNTMPELQKEVAEHEPHLALFTEDEKGVEFYKNIIKNAPEYLNRGGYLCFELGINQSGMVAEMFMEKGFGCIEIIKDLNGIERIITARFI